ncbi:hypothetical protein HY497_01440 [Candidatus Woesearchaeota archaeon]|nr:hypothetical protein [Candidatus Woesearchaeota archaeon]
MRKQMTLSALAILILLLPVAHANVISPTQADGLVAYQTLNNQTPLYRLWNLSNNFTAVKANSLNTGADLSWAVVKANHERDEIVMGTEDKDNDVNIQVFNSTGQWNNLLEVSSDVPNSAYRAFDIAVEDISGDVLIVYENSSLATNNGLAYRVWNGTGYSGELHLDSTLTSSPINWVQSTHRTGTDEIMVLLHNAAGDLHAVLWNGTGFDAVRNLTLSTATTSNTKEHFAFAWESTNGEGLVVYGTGNDLAYRTFSLSAPYWSTEATIALGNGLDAVRVCPDKASNYIGVIWQDSGNDVNVRMWDGTALLASPPAEDSSTEASGANSANIDCSWLNSTTALFGFSDVSSGNTGLLSIDYFNFTKPNTWGVSDLTTVPTTAVFASDDIEGLRFTEHPTTNELMVVAMDSAEDISLIRWNGTDFAPVGESPLEAGTEVLAGAQEGVMFAWNRYDPVPNVTLVNPSGQNFDESATLDINATVIDNVAVGGVLANVTLPNGTIKQVALANRSGNSTHFNISFAVTNLNGLYTVRIIANDTSTHGNINISETTTFGIGDFVAPNVTDITPINNASFEFQGNVEIAANATDGSNISDVFANITLPNSSMIRLTLFNQSPKNTNSKYNATFNATGIHGAYHLRIIANDTKNNINSTQATTFIVGDMLAPNVTAITPTAGSAFELNSPVSITADISDNANVSAVIANVTLPNGSISRLTLLNSTPVRYNATFSAVSLEGTYTLRIVANDSANNINSTESTTFTVGDSIAPNLTINAPSNNTNFSLRSILFNFTATDAGYASLNCSILINDMVNQTNMSVGGSRLTTFELTGFLDADYNWTVSCNDSAPNTNVSIVRYFTVDTAPPHFQLLTTAPSLEAELDPNLNVSVFANITDNTTAVHTVIFQYKLSNNSEYTNLTMLFNTGDTMYNVSFNATQNGTYNLRLWANDTVGNSETSAVATILVQFDHNWTRAPAQLAAVRTSLNLNASLGNITINNTGDYAVHFNISSDSAKTYFNESANFTVLANSVKQIEVLDNGTVAGLKSITLNITANDTRALPASQSTTASIVVAEGQPVLVSRFTTPSSGALSATQGDTDVEFVATIENIGEGNASDVVFHFRAPDGWTVTFGALSEGAAEFNSGDKVTRTIRVAIPSDAAGDYAVFANATGANSSGYNITTANLAFGDSVIVTVHARPALGSGGGSSSSAGSSSASIAAVTSGGGGGSVTKKAYGSTTETIESTEVFSVVRGLGESTPIKISNLYENAVMEHVELAAVGFLGQYVVVSAPVDISGIIPLLLLPGASGAFPVIASSESHKLTVDELSEDFAKVTVESEPQQLTLKKGNSRFVDVNGDGIGDIALRFVEKSGNRADLRVYQVRDLSRTALGYGEQLEYFLDIHAPSYLTRADFELTLMITADVVALNETAAGFARKTITEFRKLLFQVREVGEEVHAGVAQAKELLQELIDAGFSVRAVQELLAQAERSIADGNYELASDLIERIGEVRDEAFAAHDAILEAEAHIRRAHGGWLSVPQAEEALQLALIAFERGDFSTALERARNAQLQYVLETRGRVNLLWLVVNYWWALAAAAVFALVLLYYGYKYSIVLIVTQRINNLDKEEHTIAALIQETQEKYLVSKILSAEQYRRYIANYERRMTRIQQLRVTLRNKRVAILNVEQGLENIRRENKEINELLQKNQVDYFVKKSISKSRFQDIAHEYKMHLAEIEHETSVLEERLAKESGTARYSLLMLVQHLIEWLFGLFGKKRKEQSNESRLGKMMLKTVSLKASKPLPVSYSKKVRDALEKHVSAVKRSAVPHHKTHTTFHSTHEKWVSVHVPDSVKLDVHCEKTGLELPVRQRESRENAFAEKCREAFDQELLRMARGVAPEPAKEMTYLESLLPKTKRLSEKELRQWFPGAFEVMLRPDYQVALTEPVPSHKPVPARAAAGGKIGNDLLFNPELFSLHNCFQQYPFNVELMGMLRSALDARKSERRQFITDFDFDLLRMVRAGHKIKHAEGKHFLKELHPELISMLHVRRQ